MFGMAGDEESVEKALVASLWAAIISQDSVIVAKIFVHIKDSKKLDAAAWEEKVCGHGVEREACRPNPRSHQERIAHTCCTFAWGRITSKNFARSSRGAFVRGSIIAEWRGASPETEGLPPAPVPATARRGTALQDSLAQRRHATCCRGTDGRGYPLQGSTPQQQ